MSNEHEDRVRAAKVEKLVKGAVLCNGVLAKHGAGWSKDVATGLRDLAIVLSMEKSTDLWSLVELVGNVSRPPSETTKALVILALLSKAEEVDTDDAKGRDLLAAM